MSNATNFENMNQQANLLPLKDKMAVQPMAPPSLELKNKLPLHPSSSISHKQTSSLNPNMIIGG